MKTLKKTLTILLAVCVMSTSAFSYTAFASETAAGASSDAETQAITEESSEAAEQGSGDAGTQGETGGTSGTGETTESGNGSKAGVSTNTTVTIEAPAMVSAENTATGISISWESVDGATKYEVYRKTDADDWTSIGTLEADTSLTSTSYSYIDVKSNLTADKAYYYTVQAIGDNSEVSEYGTDTLIGYWLSVPTLGKATAESSGTKITWSAVSGAAGYVVYRNTSRSDWKNATEVGTTTTSTSYIDKANLTAGTTYYYTVRAYRENKTDADSNKYDSQYWSGCNETGLTSVYLATPTLKKATAESSGTKITWSAVSKASGYAVFRKKSGGSWSLVATTTKTYYTDKKSLSSGSTYYYTVRAYKGSASTAKANKYAAAYWGGYKTSGLKSVYLKTPTLSSTSVTSKKYVKVKWKKVSGATGYAVYRKVSGGSWSLIGTTTKTSYTDKKSLKNHKKYYYTVRAYKGSVKTAKKNKYNAAYWGGMNSSGVKFDCIKNSNGTLVSDKAMYNKAQKFSSKTKWLILVNTKTNKVAIFYGSKGKWDMKYYFSCTSGKSSTPTVKGSFTIKNKGKAFGSSTYTCWYLYTVLQ